MAVEVQMPRAGSSMFELELEEQSNTEVVAVLDDVARRVDRLLQEPAGIGASVAALLVEAAARARQAAASPDGVSVNLRLMGELLLLQGYPYVFLRTSIIDTGATTGATAKDSTAKDSTALPKGLRHSFLVVVLLPDSAHTSDQQYGNDTHQQGTYPIHQEQLVLVEPCFRQHFELPGSSPRYMAMWRALPEVFVGSAQQLAALVKLACAEMAAEFRRQGRPTPPWRTQGFMLAKWLPSKVASDEQLRLLPQPS